jgi:hypothetical protein
MKVYHFLIGYVALGTLVPVYLHYVTHHLWNLPQILLTFFLNLNILISFWEISLGLYIQQIHSQSKELKKKYLRNEFQAVLEFFSSPLSLQDCLTFRHWTRVWSTYSLYDPSYSNQESFGFFVDVGNGWTTLLPSILYLVGMTIDVLPARAMGIMGVIKFYQEFYGTVIYFLSFIFNKRYEGKGMIEISLFVGVSNGLWFVFPLLGMAYSIAMIYADNYDVFRSN